MEETTDDWIIVFINNETTQASKPHCHNGICDLSSCIEDYSLGIKVTQYMPIRLKINDSVQSSYTLNLLVLYREL